jgi:type IV pilus assembly protein PilC
MKIEKTTLSTNDKVMLVSNLATMLSAGIPILEAVDSLLDGSKGNQKLVLETLKADLIQGKRVYMTFSKFPRIFDKVTVNIIKASEEAGTLNITLKDIAAIIKKDTEFNDKIKSAMIYPIFILFVFIAVFLMILVVVVPKISTVFERMNVDLPLPTKIMIFMSNALLHYTIPIIVVLAIVITLFVFIYKENKSVILGLFFSLPVVSLLAREIDLTRFSRSMYLLLSAGIPITSALELSQEVVLKKEVTKAITHAKESVIAGKKVSEGLKDFKNIFPNVMIKIMEAGEKTGSLDKSMQDSSEYLDYQVSNTLKLVTSLMEPIMLVFVGVMIGGMMLAIIAPIYGMISQVGGG